MSEKINKERLTAYALGELPPAERNDVEAALSNDPALAAELAQVRKTARYLSQSMGKDAATRLSPDRRSALDAALRRQKKQGAEAAGWLSAFLKPFVLGPAVAVALVVLVVWQTGIQKPQGSVGELARQAMPPQSEPPLPASPPPQSSAPVVMESAPKAADQRALERALNRMAGKTTVPEREPSAALRDAAEEKASPGENAPSYGHVLGAAGNMKAGSPRAGAAAAPAPEKAVEADAPDQGRQFDMGPASVSAAGYDIQVTLARPIGGNDDAFRISQRIAKQLSSRAEASAAPAKRKENKAERTDYGAADENPIPKLLRGTVSLKAGQCNATLAVIDSFTGEAVRSKTQASACGREALSVTFEGLLEQVVPK